jgi:thioredoxin-like negative regulator of GroEL
MLWISNLDELDLKAGISVLYFYAPWFVLHSKVRQVLEEAEDKSPAVKFYAIDIEAFPQLVQRYQPSCLPTIKILKDEGAHIRTLTGVNQALNIAQVLADIGLAGD